jgi:hypothetical protein
MFIIVQRKILSKLCNKVTKPNQDVMPQNFNRMNNQQPKSYFKKLSEKAKAIENLYKESISERLRAKLEMIDMTDLSKHQYRPTKPRGLSILELDPETYLSDLAIDNLVSEYGDLIALDGSCVEFCTSYYGEVDTNAPPQSINPRSLFQLIRGRTAKNLDWLEVASKLLPFMKKYSHVYANLLKEMFDIECEDQMRADCQEGVEHMEWLLSEYGEDVFPDR